MNLIPGTGKASVEEKAMKYNSNIEVINFNFLAINAMRYCSWSGLAQVVLEERKRRLVVNSEQLDNTAGWPDGFWYGRRHL